MTITVYRLQCDPRKVDKSGTGDLYTPTLSSWSGNVATGTLRDRCSITDPVFMLELDDTDVGAFNYLYVDEFARYYFVKETVVERTGLVSVYCHVDVLYSFKSGITALSAYVERNENDTRPFIRDDRRILSSEVTRTVVTPDVLHADQFKVSPVTATAMTDPTIIMSVANPALSGLIRPYAVDLTHPTDDWAVDANPDYTSGAINTFLYALTGSQLASFYTYLNTEDWGTSNTAVKRLLVDHGIEGVIDVYAYPFKMAEIALMTSKYHIVKDPGTTKHIYMYGEDTGCDAYITYQNCNPIIDFGTFSYATAPSSFMDFEPYTRCQMYLPYIGMTEIPMEVMANSGVSVKYFVDLATGKCQCLIKGSDAYVQTLSGQIGVRVPLMGSNINDALKNTLHSMETAVKGGLQALASAPTLNIGGMISGAMQIARGAHTALYNPVTMTSTALESNLGRAQYCNPYALFTRQKDLTPGDYGKFIGYPKQDVVTLSTLSGFTIVGEVFGHMAFAMEDEHKEIMSLLKTGVIL